MYAQLVTISSLALVSAFYGRDNTGEPSFPQLFQDQFNPIKYTANYGPYSQRTGVGLSTNPPAGCEVDQVVILSRHGERYASKSDTKHHRKILKKLQDSTPKGGFVGSLNFLNSYEYFLENDSYAGIETESGPYAGLSNLYRSGAKYAEKYRKLWTGDVTPVFTADYERVIESARWFAKGFFGLNYTTAVAINSISENATQGANSLTPYDCPGVEPTWCDASEDEDFYFPEFDVAALRLNQENGLSLDAKDITTLLQLASFDVSVRGYSPWINVFTPEEWITFEYVTDLNFHCFYGSGSPRALATGGLWVNATLQLLNDGPEKSLPLTFAFAHDTNVAPVIAAVGAVVPSKNLSTEQVTFDTGYRVTDVIPMGGRLIFERLKCTAKGLTTNTSFVAGNASYPLTNQTYPTFNGTCTNCTTVYPGNATESVSDSLYVRVILNDAVTPLDYCNSGPGFSCPLDEYTQKVKARLAAYPYTPCQQDGTPQSLDFLWNYSTNTSTAEQGTVPYQAGAY